MKSLRSLSQDLANGTTTSRTLVEEGLEAIESGSEGARAFIAVTADAARNVADAHDTLRKSGAELGPYAGIPMSIKDLYDVKGQVSAAGSVILKDAPAAECDAPTVARCRQAGFVFMGRTNMTEFAYSGLGLNPHHGTPSSPWDRETGRIPGGSSSGSAVSVADGMAAITIGTDTGGSCRIPAAFNGITGYKPTASRVPLDRIVPLAFSLDSAGPLGQTVDCCAIVDAILAGQKIDIPVAADPNQLHFAVPQTLVFDGMDDTVASAFDHAIKTLSDAGVQITEIPLGELAELPKVGAKGGFAAAEAYAWHRNLLEQNADGYDPRVGGRIVVGRNQSAADYIQLLDDRKRIIAATDVITAPYDALLFPTVSIVAPTIAEVDNDDTYGPANILVLRNTSVGNFLDRCSISLPCHRPGDAPVGLMLTGARNQDARLFQAAKSVESILATTRNK